MARLDVNTLTMEQYLALSRENQAPGVVKPEIGGNVNLEIKSQFMRELREDTFSRIKDEDAHDHIDRILSIVGLFNILGVTKDADLLKKAFIQRYCPPSMTAKQLEDIHNFKQKGDESLYLAWEQYNNLPYKCPTHDINSHQKLNIFYKGLSTMNHQLLDLQGPIPQMRPAEALTAIQTIVDHSQKWHDSTTSRNIKSSSSNDGLAALVKKLDNLGRDLKKLKESVHTIQVGCQICEGLHLDKDFPLNEEVKQVEEVRCGEFRRTAPFNRSNGGKFHVGPPGYYTKIDNRPPYGEKRIQKLGGNYRDRLDSYSFGNLTEFAASYGVTATMLRRDKELAGRRRYRFLPNFKFQSNAKGVSCLNSTLFLLFNFINVQ
ncbi:hypothetical protein Tco_0661922 [Tanacetum coccineum]